MKVYELIDDTQGEAYPVRFYPIPEENRRKLVESLNYMRHYSVWSLVVLFLGLSFFGWLWEVGMHLVSYGTFVNRGALHGPWLPIYGTGSVLILTLLYRLRRNPALEFIATIVVCGFLEYMTSLVMEIATGGTEVVGLQRIFSESKRQDLRRGSSRIRYRRPGDHLRHRPDGGQPRQRTQREAPESHLHCS